MYGKAEEKHELFERYFFTIFQINLYYILHRSCFLPLFKYAQEQKSDIMSFGFFTSTYNVHTSFIYKSLGLHEPVYGKLPTGNPSRYLNRVKTTTLTFNDTFEEKGNRSEPLTSEHIKELLNDSRTVAYPVPLTKEKFSRNRLLNNTFDAMNQGKTLQPVRISQQLRYSYPFNHSRLMKRMECLLELML